MNMGMIQATIAICLFGLCCAHPGEGNRTGQEQGRDYGGPTFVTGPPQLNNYESYDHYGQYNQYDKWPMSPLSSAVGGCGGGCWFKAALVGVAAAFLVKLPLLLFLKFILVKTAVPVALAVAAAPLLLPLFYMLLVRPGAGGGSSRPQGDKEDPSTPSPMEMMMGRQHQEADPVLKFLEAPDCLLKIACSLGAQNADAGYVKAVTWGLNTIESLWPSILGVGGKEVDLAMSSIQAYKTAYRDGALSKGQSCIKHHCALTKILFKHEKSNVNSL